MPTPTTHFAAIDTDSPSGAVYGIGTTPEAAIADAKKGGADAELRTVPMTEAAAAFVLDRGGAPSRHLVVTSRGVSMNSEWE